MLLEHPETAAVGSSKLRNLYENVGNVRKDEMLFGIIPHSERRTSSLSGGIRREIWQALRIAAWSKLARLGPVSRSRISEVDEGITNVALAAEVDG